MPAAPRLQAPRNASRIAPSCSAVIERSLGLDQLFGSGAAEGTALRALVADIARLPGELRFTHLKYHLAMRRLLSMEQVAAYDAARNYAGGQGDPREVPRHDGGGGHHHWLLAN